MRRTKRFAGFALAACMGVSLLVNVPAGTVSAAEPEEVVSGEMSATETDAEALDEAREVVYDESKVDEDGFVWDGTTLVKYVGKGGDVKIPEKCTSIGYDAFSFCSGLTSIEIPSGVTSIADYAFYACSGLKSIEIPSRVTSIGDMAFSWCENLESIVVTPQNAIYNSNGRSNAIIETKTNTLIQGCKNTKIPSNVRSIGDNAFYGCSGLTSIKLSEGVTSIGVDAFYGCGGLTSIAVSDSNLAYNSKDGCNAIIETKTNTLIRGCENTKIPSDVTSIGGEAFSFCSGLKSIEIPLSVTSIGNGAFRCCSGLTSIKLPEGVTSIGDGAFFRCSGLTSIEIPSGVTRIGEGAFYICSGLTSIKLPERVTSIGEMAFMGCSGLTSIKMPSSVTSIGATAFEASGLKTIYGYAGSYAETYAIANGYTFEDVEGKITTSYRTHVQSFGWQNPVTNGVMSGTTGKAKRLEGIEISVSGNKNLGIQYATHCQTYGWLPWSANGEMSGTTGEAKRLEAIEIRLTGADKDKYDVYYRVHAQSYGWLGWAKNGEPSGTAGYAKRLEGIQIVVVKKTEAAPGLDYAGVNASKGVHDSRAYIAKTNGTITIPGSADSTNIMYKTQVQSFGWQNWVFNGTMSGTSGKAKRLEGINIKLSNAAYAGGIQYRTHIQTYGWEKEWKKDGVMSGTSGKAKRLEAIQIKLYGEMANHFDVYYRVHAQSYGWLGWAKNGEESGTAGLAKRLEGIQIVLIPKGGAAPANNYKNIQSVNTKAYIKK